MNLICLCGENCAKGALSMTIGKLSIGKRICGMEKFHFFYCPLLKRNKKQHFRFFWWIGKHWYIVLSK